ncbi:hypothetical protein PFISCL1PPCAC_3457, partial [Pristionchus fissidentatus]
TVSMHTVVVLLAVATAVAAQCTGNDHPSCSSWKRNNYCTNNSPETVKKYCGVACGFCTRDGFQTAKGGGNNLPSCVDANANCASWQATRQFCTNPANSNAVKLQYCCATCRPAVLATRTTVVPSTVLPSTVAGTT